MQNTPNSVRNLQIWRDGIALIKKVYTLSKKWPKDELYGLTNQARRAVVSIPANLAEGAGRASRGEIARFAQIALGSAYELDTLLEIAIELEFSTSETVHPLQAELNSLSRRISKFIRYQESKNA